MAGSVAEWTAELRKHIAECRAKRPLTPRKSLSAAEEWRCRLVGGALMRWMKETGPRFLQERSVMCKTLGIDPEPFIAFTSDAPGLAAANQVIGADNPRADFLFEDEFQSCPARLTDPGYKWHIHFWSYVSPTLDPKVEAEARARHPIADGCVYWLHREGTLWAANAGRGADHLWKWDGEKPELLEEAYTQICF